MSDLALTLEEKLQLLEPAVEFPSFEREEMETLQRYLDDPAAEVRLLALKALWSYPEPELIPPLIAAATQDEDESVRCQAIRTLGRYLYEGEMADYDLDFPMKDLLAEDELPQEDFLRVKEFLLGVYRDPARSLDERRAAVEAIGFLWEDAAVDIIEEAYAHPEPRMKISAIFAMGRNGNSRWISTLRRELYNPDPEIRWEAVRAAGELQAEELGRDLLRLTYSEDRDVQEAAVWALGQSGWAGAFERLDELSTGMDPDLRDIAEDALEEWFIFSQMQSEEPFEDEFEEME